MKTYNLSMANTGKRGAPQSLLVFGVAFLLLLAVAFAASSASVKAQACYEEKNCEGKFLKVITCDKPLCTCSDGCENNGANCGALWFTKCVPKQQATSPPSSPPAGIAAGCVKNSYCGDGVVSSGEDCDTALNGPYQSDSCPDGSVRYKSCGSNCHWQYSPATCPACGNGKTEGGEVCDWGAKNGVWATEGIDCPSGFLSRHYTCSQDCSKFIYDQKCSTCGNNIWEPPTEDCDAGGKVGVGWGGSDLTTCPGYDTPQLLQTDCGVDCKWHVQKCPKLPIPCSEDSTQSKCGKCVDTTECSGNSVVTRNVCTDSSGKETKNEIKSTTPCSSKEFCASVDGIPQCVPDCDKAVSCSPWSEPQPGNVCSRTCTSSDATCPIPAQTTTSADGVPCTFHCYNGVTDAGEEGVDCGETCSNTCPIEIIAGLVCGDGSCNGGETCGSCQKDCGTCPGPGPCVPAIPCSSLGCGVADSCGTYCGNCLPPPGCTPQVSCSALGCGNTDSCGKYCGDCVPSTDPCQGVSDPDKSQVCCESKGFVWAKSGETRAFGGFAKLGQAGCVGDDLGEFMRFRECEGGVCATDAADSAACASINSCVNNGNCFTRLDKTVQEEPAIAALVQGCKGQSDDNCKLVNEVDDAEKRAENTNDRTEKRRIAKDEIAPRIDKLKKRGIIKEEEKNKKEIGPVAKPAGIGIAPKTPGATPGSTGNTLLCIPK